jgi:hypothetical protein
VLGSSTSQVEFSVWVAKFPKGSCGLNDRVIGIQTR